MNSKEAYYVLDSGVSGPRFHEAIGLAKKSLIKQVPLKAQDNLYCPICEFYIGDINGDHFLYCPMCGQRIDDSKPDYLRAGFDL